VRQGRRGDVPALRALALLGALLAPAPVRAQMTGPVPARPFRLSLSYTADCVRVARGGRAGDTCLGNGRVGLTADLARAGLTGTHLFLEGLVDHGGAPSDLVGDLQGVDNIEAPHAARLYEAWIEHVSASGWSVLAGFYDLNSEFDVADAPSVFVNSSFGVSAGLGLSGRRGPSIFPTTSLGVRLRVAPTPDSYAQMAVLDGVPARVANGLPPIRLGGGEGALVVLEGGIVGGAPGGRMPGVPRAQMRRRRVDLADGETPTGRKLALGAWGYTGWLPRADAVSTGRMVHGSFGAYALGETWLYREARDASRGARAYAELGWTAGRADPVRFFAGAAVAYTGMPRADDELGLGLAMAAASRPYRNAFLDAPPRSGRAETVLELTWRRGVAGRLFIQPDIQLVFGPLADPAVRRALLAGLRVEVAL